jgi:hypothetical protein
LRNEEWQIDQSRKGAEIEDITTADKSESSTRDMFQVSIPLLYLSQIPARCLEP